MSIQDGLITEMKIPHEEFNGSFFFISYGWVDAYKRNVFGAIFAIQNKWFPYEESIENGKLIFDKSHNGLAVAHQM